MKKYLPLYSLAVLGLGWGLWTSPTARAVPAQNADETLPLVQSIAEQQKLINENQANIDKSLASIQEDLRQARIYVSRVGKPK